ncbi:MAG: site-specific DNA-methyltransferase [Candidatus Heimdallarchaeota archaeon]|nr:MAG: site-specific DNA-methyltransferase [Candidatus Heimdallarchaeota archaeon]
MIKLINAKFESIYFPRVEKISLIIADPPDNINLKYNDFLDNQPIQVYTDQLNMWLYKMKNITNGPIFFTFNEKWTYIVEKIIHQLKIPLIQRLQWYYSFGQDQTSKNKYGLCYRPIYWLNSDYMKPEAIKIPSARQTKYNDKRAAKGGKLPPNVWEFSRICGTFKEKRKWCPTQLPEKLVERIIKGHYPNEGYVLDPFLGSGTVPIICQKLGINCLGVEVSEPIIRETSKYIGVDYE